MNVVEFIDKTRGYFDHSGYEATCESTELKVSVNQSLLADNGIALLEKTLDVSLEASLKDAWLCADGSDNTLFARAGYLTGYNFLSVQEAIAQREGMRQREKQYAEYAEPKPRDGRIKDGWFQSGWVPFASFGGATLLLIADYSTASGKPGQIIAFSHDPDQIEYVSDGFESFLESSWQQISEDPEEFLCY